MADRRWRPEACQGAGERSLNGGRHGSRRLPLGREACVQPGSLLLLVLQPGWRVRGLIPGAGGSEARSRRWVASQDGEQRRVGSSVAEAA